MIEPKKPEELKVPEPKIVNSPLQRLERSSAAALL